MLSGCGLVALPVPLFFKVDTLDLGFEDSPCERPGKLYRAARNDSVWTEQDEAAFYAKAPVHLHLALTLALWTSYGFRGTWRKACTKAGIKGLTFHDLRGTAVTRLARAGCSVPEIATITGHSLKDVGAILDGHYLSRDIDLAETAIRKLEESILPTDV